MVRTGKNSEAFWGLEALWKDGIGIATHQPFNVLSTFTPPFPEYSYVQYRGKSSKAPYIYFTERLSMNSSDVDMYTYRDPFLACAFFGHKVVGGSWGVGLTGTIDADFSAYDHKDTIWNHYRLADENGILDEERTIVGIEIPKYVMSCEEGQLMKEVVTLQGVDFVDESVAFVPDSDFDDGEFGDWAIDSDDGYHSTEVEVSWCGTGMDAVYGLARTGFTLTLENEKHVRHDSSSLIAQHHWDGDENNSIDVRGVWKGAMTLLEEVEKIVEDKTKCTIRVQWDDRVGHEKYVEFTNAFVEKVDNRTIPKANEEAIRTFTFKGAKDSKASFHGSFVGKPDPSGRITN